MEGVSRAPKVGLAAASHAIEPQYPGAFESLVFLSDCWDEAALQAARGAIMETARRTSRCHERCCRFLNAAASLMQDSRHLVEGYVDKEKIRRYAARLCHREFPAREEARPGREQVRFLSAVTAEGVTLYEQTPGLLCPRLYLVEDEQGVASRILLEEIRSRALAAGLDVVSCYCCMAPFHQLEHLLIPEAGLGFLTANRHHPFSTVSYVRRIHARRFLDAEGVRSKKQRLSFNRKAVAELLGEASRLLAEAKTCHDQLESHYTPCVDFQKVEEKTQRLAGQFRRLSGRE